MKKAKILAARKAIDCIESGKTFAVDGFCGIGVPEELYIALQERFLQTGKPNHMTMIFAACQGDMSERGFNHLAEEGLVSTAIGGHWNNAPKLQKLAMENKMTAYNLPLGVISQTFRETAAGKPFLLSKVGLKTFVDPRVEGGRLNKRTTEDIVDLVELYGEEYLVYKTRPIHYALLRGTYADQYGNISLDHEACKLELTAVAQACKNSGGTVIVQVEKIVDTNIPAKNVIIPGIYVDIIVPVCQKENHQQTFATLYNPSYSGEVHISLPAEAHTHMPLNARKIICRRAAMELQKGSIVNLGIGMPEGIAAVAQDEGEREKITLTIESGPIGGLPLSGLDFGAAANPQAIIGQASQFDFYQGRGLDQAFLGLAECDERGNVNVSKFGPKIAGWGGFIDITQNAKMVAFCGTFTSSGLTVSTGDGKLRILKEGRIRKICKAVQQITFSAKYAIQTGQKVLYITERAVFGLSSHGLVLQEVAPGIDLKHDVLDKMEASVEISPSLKEMDTRLFRQEKMGLSIQ
ncbi:acyl CoA:acetate/3-ketoacid CoA transferase [Christensenella minuta]|uniref:acyl CoA:acetate/3-ketoacid CoA transferase n=1 Tax=Christensenella minuta TaxID=626937 RepID=UPI000EAE801A|nr:CoA-transferase [Christensenella minuta]AYH41506.1 acyl CoA:acetate/3-ketoacid CoA transferase [Christensenella minuta]